MLPRKAARVVPATTDIVPGSFPQVIGLENTGVGAAQNDAYALLATSPRHATGGRGERFFGAPSDVPGLGNDPAGLAVYDYGLFPG